jgi:hypothetical protein
VTSVQDSHECSKREDFPATRYVTIKVGTERHWHMCAGWFVVVKTMDKTTGLPYPPLSDFKANGMAVCKASKQGEC